MDDFEAFQAYLPFILKGIPVTLTVAFLAMCVAIPVAFVLALGRMSKSAWLNMPAGFVIELFRGSSSLVQLFWVFYVLPFFGLELQPLAAGVLVLGVNSGSYMSEIVRAGLNAVPAGQREAALALGFSARYRFFRIILPQALPIMIPPFGNAMITMLKFTSLVSLVTIQDLTFRANMVGSTMGDSSAIYVLVILVYFGLSLLLALLGRYLERVVNRRSGRAGALSGAPEPSRVPGWALGRSA
ncbi:MAG: ectoine/hydroxyectoine ABC transporter permease subunit EhuC [Beijerinckiaceae bacterium]|nr:ectoine/hydroxyectoine ABC transporter permease subunit EhuC [Beijerinckiaceae bacterium]